MSGLEQALHFQSSPMDGPLQLFNALRRIMAGQQPGVDFQFFHGLGVPYLHYLPFRLFGSDFAAAEVTRHALTALAHPLVLVAFFRAFTGDWRKTLMLASIAMALSLALRLSTIVVAINSLLGVRSLFATLVPIVWYASRRSRWGPLITGLVLGCALLTGTEQGMAVFGAMLVVGLVVAGRDPAPGKRFAEIAATLATGLATMLTFLLATGGWDGLRGALRYNLRLLPGDQYWYFGAPPNPFIGGWADAFRLMAETPLIPVAIAAALALFIVHVRGAWRAADDQARAWHGALAAMCLYGLASSASVLGIFLVGYVQPCTRVVLLVGLLDLSSRIQVDPAAERPSPSRSPVVLAIAALVVMLLSVPTIVVQSLASLPHTVAAHVIGRQGVTFEGFWPRALALGDSIVRANGLTPAKPVWSTYAGLLEARHDMFNPSFDYIIHALGPENRREYARRFAVEKPRIVQTVLPQFSPYESWLEQTSWDFYRELITNYRAAAATPWSIFWERLPNPTPPPFLISSTRLAAGQDQVTVSLPPAAGPPGFVLLQVEVTYKVQNRLSGVPVFGNMPRYLVEIDGAVSRGPVTLDPFVERSAFPLVAVQGKTIRVRFETRALLPGASMDVSEVRVSAIPVSSNMIPWLQNLSASEVARGPRPR